MHRTCTIGAGTFTGHAMQPGDPTGHHLYVRGVSRSGTTTYGGPWATTWEALDRDPAHDFYQCCCDEWVDTTGRPVREALDAWRDHVAIAVLPDLDVTFACSSERRIYDLVMQHDHPAAAHVTCRCRCGLVYLAPGVKERNHLLRRVAGWETCPRCRTGATTPAPAAEPTDLLELLALMET